MYKVIFTIIFENWKKLFTGCDILHFNAKLYVIGKLNIIQRLQTILIAIQSEFPRIDIQ